MKVYAVFVFLCVCFAACHHEKPVPVSGDDPYIELKGIEEIDVNVGGSFSIQADHIIVAEAVKRQKARLVATLVYYGVPVKFTGDGKITVPKSRFTDPEFLYDLSLKARDTAWYRKHILPGY